ncbi:MAG: prepilin-type N-terminal cleavage/methylation domain-containing protein [Pleurocapsa minor HA4230-MV1]|jgi:type IV pilus assembly protein PilA|nr:prepilin-type N-terminal cleavage/methylation domain-containing protein [Pleurocapsa minor HA4230-MV1]
MKTKKIVFFLKNIYQNQNIQKNKGFTLIELLVVVIIISVLSAVSIPNIILQVGKARETEAKTNLSSLGQSQQIYFFQKATFANQISKLDIHISPSGFYSYPNPSIANSSLVKHTATNSSSLTQATKNYAMGVYFVSGDFGIVLCQGNTIGGTTVDAPNTNTGTCVDGVEVR